MNATNTITTADDALDLALARHPGTFVEVSDASNSEGEHYYDVLVWHNEATMEVDEAEPLARYAMVPGVTLKVSQ